MKGLFYPCNISTGKWPFKKINVNIWKLKIFRLSVPMHVFGTFLLVTCVFVVHVSSSVTLEFMFEDNLRSFCFQACGPLQNQKKLEGRQDHWGEMDGKESKGCKDLKDQMENHQTHLRSPDLKVCLERKEKWEIQEQWVIRVLWRINKDNKNDCKELTGNNEAPLSGDIISSLTHVVFVCTNVSSSWMKFLQSLKFHSLKRLNSQTISSFRFMKTSSFLHLSHLDTQNFVCFPLS